jgi:sortase A
MSATATRGRVRSGLRRLSALLIVSGCLLLADAAATLAWKEPVSSLYARFQQRDLQAQVDRLDTIKPTPVQEQALRKLPDPKRRLAFAARSVDRKTHAGDALGKLRIDRIALSAVFVEGTDAGDLRKGPGHYPGTPLPGRRGTVAIAGHRTTYGAPFRNLDKVKPGDEVRVAMPYGRFTYRVERTRIVAPTAVWVTQRVSHDRLVLSACHPLYSAAKRIVVFARLIRSIPRGATA